MQWSSYYELTPGSNKYIYIPTNQSRELGKIIVETIRKRWTPPAYFFHLRKGGHLAAIKHHIDQSCNPRKFSVFDISGYFGQVTENKLCRVLKNFVSFKKASQWAHDSTVRKPSENKRTLPYGFLQSGDLASLVLDRSYLGCEFRKIHQNPNIKLSVFVDDIIVSSSDPILLDQASIAIKDAAKLSNLKLNQDKTCCNVDEIEIFNIHCNQNFCLSFSQEKLNKFEKIIENHYTDPRVVFGVINYMLNVSTNDTIGFVNKIIDKYPYLSESSIELFSEKIKHPSSTPLKEHLRSACFHNQKNEIPF